ncbi:MAG: hypothetical protein Kow0037_08390 [Calditrichia bacterium]
MFSSLFQKFPYLKSTLAIIAGVVTLDQLTKYLAKVFLSDLPGNQPYIKILGDFFRLTYVENPGIAFGIRINNKVFFTLLSLLAIVVVFIYLLQLRDHFVLRIAFAFILGGAFGNLYDRMVHGKVIDFLDFEFFNIHLPSFKLLFFEFHGYYMQRWPVFNIADIAVSLGMILIILNAIFDREQPSVTYHES